MPDELPSGPVKYELDNGRLVMMAPPGGDHGRMQIRIGAILWNFVQKHRLGEVFGEVGVILRRDPDRVVGPDAAFVGKRLLPARMSSEGYLETIPELVVEVRSKNDSIPEIRAKAKEYFEAGVQILWVVDPISKSVSIYRRGRKLKKLRPGNMLIAEGILPGFKARVSELFD